MKQVIRPAAKDDILRQFRYYLLEDALDAATRFLEAVDQSIEAICTSAEIRASPQAPCNINLSPVLVPDNCKPCDRSKL